MLGSLLKAGGAALIASHPTEYAKRVKAEEDEREWLRTNTQPMWSQEEVAAGQASARRALSRIRAYLASPTCQYEFEFMDYGGHADAILVRIPSTIYAPAQGYYVRQLLLDEVPGTYGPSNPDYDGVTIAWKQSTLMDRVKL